MNNIDSNILTENIKRLPIDGLPYGVQEIINTYAKALNVPTEFVTGAAMSATAQAAGSRFYWSNGLYTNFPQFYTALLGDSTANKTTSIREMLKPIRLEDSRIFEQWKSETEGMKKDEKAKIPRKCLLLNDSTLEAYQKRLSDNPDGITVYNDELLSFFGNLTRYKPNSSDEKFYLTCFGNSESFTIARVGETTTIPHPIVRIIGGVQPEVLQPYFAGSMMLSDGMLPRFLWYTVPEDFKLEKIGEVTRTDEVQNSWGDIMHKLLSHPTMTRLVFDNEAQALYQNYKNSHIMAKNAKTLKGYEVAVCGKLEIYAIMWAMTSRLLRYAAEEVEAGDTMTILGYDMNYSLRCMDYFRQTAMSVYRIITEGAAIPLKDRILALKGIIKNQSQFAKSIGVSQQYVNGILNLK